MKLIVVVVAAVLLAESCLSRSINDDEQKSKRSVPEYDIFSSIAPVILLNLLDQAGAIMGVMPASYPTRMQQKTDELMRCKFPFLHEGRWYNDCVYDVINPHQSWCGEGNLDDDDVDRNNIKMQCFPKNTTKIVRNGTCHFPFTLNGVSYSKCTNLNSDLKHFVCGTTANVDEDHMVRLCDESEIASAMEVLTEEDADTCRFPFKYEDSYYFGCITSLGRSEPWCGTVEDVDEQPAKWGFCGREVREVVQNDPRRRIEGSIKKCHFPFSYEGEWYYGCTNYDMSNRHQFWCATAEHYSSDEWQLCPTGFTSDLPTFGGSANGAACMFPFMYDDVIHHGCVTKGGEKMAWCYTSRDDTWGYCNAVESVEHQRKFADTNVTTTTTDECVFPFRYNNQLRHACEVTGDVTWCSTTPDYDHDVMWSECSKQTTAFGVKSEMRGNRLAEGAAWGEKIKQTPCSFPFKYQGMLHTEPLPYRSGPHFWCSRDYDFDRHQRKLFRITIRLRRDRNGQLKFYEVVKDKKAGV